MAYQILALDLDGTLTNSKKEITKPTLDALIEIQEAGKKKLFSPADARQKVSFHWQSNFIWKIMEVTSFSFNGGRITDCRTKKAIYNKNTSG